MCSVTCPGLTSDFRKALMQRAKSLIDLGESFRVSDISSPLCERHHKVHSDSKLRRTGLKEHLHQRTMFGETYCK